MALVMPKIAIYRFHLSGSLFCSCSRRKCSLSKYCNSVPAEVRVLLGARANVVRIQEEL